MAPLSDAQMKSMKVVPRVNACLSFLGSAYILFSMLRARCTGHGVQARQRQLRRPVLGKTLLVGMSLTDLVSSLCYVIGDVAFPEEKGGWGNQATCNAQAFIVHLQVGAALYSGFLAWYYCLYTRYRWREARARKYYEPLAHLFVWLFVIITGSIAVHKEIIHPHWIRCYISGPGTNAYFWGFFFIPIWVSMGLGTIAMVLIYGTVRAVEVRSMRWRVEDQLAAYSSSVNLANNPSAGSAELQLQEEARNKHPTLGDLPKTRRVAYQGMCYTFAFICTYIFPTTSRLIMTFGSKPPPYAIRFLAVSSVTLQGLWNWVVYYVQPHIYDWWLKRQRRRQDQRRQAEESKTAPEEQERPPHHAEEEDPEQPPVRPISVVEEEEEEEQPGHDDDNADDAETPALPSQ